MLRSSLMHSLTEFLNNSVQVISKCIGHSVTDDKLDAETD